MVFRIYNPPAPPLGVGGPHTPFVGHLGQPPPTPRSLNKPMLDAHKVDCCSLAAADEQDSNRMGRISLGTLLRARESRGRLPAMGGLSPACRPQDALGQSTGTAPGTTAPLQKRSFSDP